MRTTDSLRLGTRGPTVPVLLHEQGDGPSVVITANVHGDEVTGVAVVHAVDRWLSERLERGRVALYPSLNPEGLRSGARRFGDGGDLNRAFPGSARGGAANRAANAIWTDLMRRSPVAAIDLHTDSAVAEPYALVDRAVHRKADRQSLEAQAVSLASASGFRVLREYPDAEYVRYSLDRSLAGALLNRAAVPTVTLEVGPRRVIDPAAVSIALAAVCSMLSSLGVVDGLSTPEPVAGRWRRSAAPRAELSGVFIPSISPGASFESGQVLGAVRTLAGEPLAELRAPGRGVVVSWAEGSWVDAGSTVGTLALEED